MESWLCFNLRPEWRAIETPQRDYEATSARNQSTRRAVAGDRSVTRSALISQRCLGSVVGSWVMRDRKNARKQGAVIDPHC